MGRNGRQDKVIGVGKNNGTAARERVAGRAGGGGKDETIRPIGVQIISVDKGVDGNHGRSVPFEDGKIVEGEGHVAKKRGVGF